MKPLPGLDIPVIISTGNMNQSWFEFFQSLVTLLNSSVGTLAGIPALIAAKSDILRTINPQTGTTYTFALVDNGALCEFTNGSPITVTIPTNASVAFPVGTQIDVVQGGAGKVTFAAAGGVTLKSVASNKSLSAQEAGATLDQMSANVWRLVGSLIP